VAAVGIAGLAAAMLCAVGASSASAAAPVGSYVSLGDSLAFGYQPNLVAAGDFNPADYRGYPEDYAAMRPGLELANFGCPGETTQTLISGGCPWPAAALHEPFGGMSQLNAALAYLHTHSDTSLISVDIGSNDLLGLVDGCLGAADVSACLGSGLPATLATLAGNYATILVALKTAAPQAQLVVFNLYNPLVLALPGSDQLLAGVNQEIAQIAASFGATVADAFSAINHKAGSPAEPDFVCSRTWECSSYQNIHPDDLGYKQMAIALLHATEH
jgi:lysophospholipase L1-like esterase